MTGPAAIDRKRARANERQRRRRARRRAGLHVLAVELVKFQFTEALVEAGRLGQWDEDDRGAIDRAATKVFEDWILRVTRDGVDPLVAGKVHSDDVLTPDLPERNPTLVRR